MKIEPTTKEIAKTITKVKPSAIWARVSTKDQSETSLLSQVDRCKEKLEQLGYFVTHTLQADWSSMDLYACPKFQELRQLIQNQDIDAVAVFDRDRLEAKGLQRLLFLSECKEAGIDLVICQGPPILAEPEGQLVELALALGKERQVMRARQGSRDGLHDRALKRGLPVRYHSVYGYEWDKERNWLVPDQNWPNVKMIFKLLLGGAGYGTTIKELKKRGILSPSGMAEWNKAVISQIAHNPLYAGKYYALKKRAVEPAKRKGKTYGNSSNQSIPLDEAHYLPRVKVVKPPITWGQRVRILEQLANHQKLARRNASRDYLLRGRIFCRKHFGKRGEPRVYHGKSKGNTWYYACPVGGCKVPHIPGPWLEARVKYFFYRFFSYQEEEFLEIIKGQGNKEKTEKQLKQELASLEREFEQLVSKLARLESDHYDGTIDPDAYTRLKTQCQVRKQWIKERQDQILVELSNLGQEHEAILSLKQIRERFTGRIYDATDNEWQSLFNTLDLTITLNKPSKTLKGMVLDDKHTSFMMVESIAEPSEHQKSRMKKLSHTLTPPENFAFSKSFEKRTGKKPKTWAYHIDRDYIITILLNIPLNSEKLAEFALSYPEHG